MLKNSKNIFVTIIKRNKEKEIRERKKREIEKSDNLLSLVVVKWWEMSTFSPRSHSSEVPGLLS
jgi:hypothetical protein